MQNETGLLSLFNVALVVFIVLIPLALKTIKIVQRLGDKLPLESLKRPIMCIVATPVVLQTCNFIELFFSTHNGMTPLI